MNTLTLFLTLGALCLASLTRAEPALELLQASFFGTTGEDDIQSGAAGPDGAIYLAGNVGAPVTNWPGTRFGADAEKARCGRGFVLRLSADGQKVTGYAEFGAGIASVTTVQVNERGVYVAGYATEHLAPLLAKVPGLIREYPLQEQARRQAEAESKPDYKPDSVAESRHGQLGRFGAPFIVRLSADLKAIEAGTYLEGWQQVWGKDRCIQVKPAWKVWPRENNWHPTLVGLLKSGDVVVAHDGGYFRDLTAADDKFVSETVERLIKEGWEPTNSGEKRRAATMNEAEKRAHYRTKLRNALGFSDVCDHLSRLSPDLDKRAYRQPIYTPATDPTVAAQLKYGWPHPHFSNPRTHRLALDKDDNIYLAGWSATETSQEPWWAGYVWKMNAADGSVIHKILERDPMSGGGNRMNGNVADRGASAVAVDGDKVFYSTYSDGGWSGVIHFSGSIFQWTPDATGEGTQLARTGPCFWVTDMQALPGGRLLAMGRANFIDKWPAEAWQSPSADENPVAWLRLYDDKSQPAFTTALRGLLPHQLVALGGGRYLVVGQSVGKIQTVTGRGTKDVAVTEADNPGVAVTKNALQDKHAGQSDGYWLIVEVK